MSLIRKLFKLGLCIALSLLISQAVLARNITINLAASNNTNMNVMVCTNQKDGLPVYSGNTQNLQFNVKADKPVRLDFVYTLTNQITYFSNAAYECVLPQGATSVQISGHCQNPTIKDNAVECNNSGNHTPTVNILPVYCHVVIGGSCLSSGYRN